MLAYLIIGAYLAYMSEKLSRKATNASITAKDNIVITTLWGLFLLMDITTWIRSKLKKDKTLEEFNNIENNTPKLIALVGYSGSGKDTAADYLVSSKGFKKYSFASPLKALCELLYGKYGLKGEKHYNDNRDDRKTVLYTDEHGKAYTAVDVWVEVGTKLREVHPDVWLDMLQGTESHRIVIADCRHPNEVAKVKELGGTVIFIKRDVEINPSAKMDGLIQPEDCDLVIDNNGTLQDLHKELDKI